MFFIGVLDNVELTFCLHLTLRVTLCMRVKHKNELCFIAHNTFLHVRLCQLQIMFTMLEIELFNDAFSIFGTPACQQASRKYNHCTILFKTFIIYKFGVFVMFNCLLLRLKFHECFSRKCDVNFHKSVCQHSENHLTRIFLHI